MSPQATANWLKGVSASVIGFGVLTVLAAYPGSAEPLRFLIDMIFWPLDGAETLSAPATQLISAVGGGVMVGWGLMLWLVSARLYPRDPDLARTIILTSVGAWFIVDSAGSIAAGAPANAVLNTGFLLAYFYLLRRQKQAAMA
jgi:hypothetical protein